MNAAPQPPTPQPTPQPAPQPVSQPAPICKDGVCNLPRRCNCKSRPRRRLQKSKPKPPARRTHPPPLLPPRFPRPEVKTAVARQTAPLRGTHPRPTRVTRSSPTVAKYQRAVLRLVNRSRAAVGAGKLTLNGTLNSVARRHNADQAFMLGYISHEGSDGRHVGDRLRGAGYKFRFAGENVAAGQSTPAHVHRSLMRSDGHRRNLLNGNFDEMGLHVGRGSDGRLWWTQIFGRRKSGW